LSRGYQACGKMKPVRFKKIRGNLEGAKGLILGRTGVDGEGHKAFSKKPGRRFCVMDGKQNPCAWEKKVVTQNCRIEKEGRG